MIQTPRHRPHWGLAACVAVLLAVAGCSSDEPDPAQQRRERVETRLSETFSNDQADCIVKTIDEDTLRALDRTVDLDPDGKPMLTYTVAVRTCVTSPAPADTAGDDTATTTTDG